MCGGYNSGSTILSSCEVNVAGEDNWSTMTSLPGERSGVRGLTIDNRVLITGFIFKYPQHMIVISNVQEGLMDRTMTISTNWTLQQSSGVMLVNSLTADAIMVWHRSTILRVCGNIASNLFLPFHDMNLDLDNKFDFCIDLFLSTIHQILFLSLL